MPLRVSSPVWLLLLAPAGVSWIRYNEAIFDQAAPPDGLGDQPTNLDALLEEFKEQDDQKPAPGPGDDESGVVAVAPILLQGIDARDLDVDHGMKTSLLSAEPDTAANKGRTSLPEVSTALSPATRKNQTIDCKMKSGLGWYKQIWEKLTCVDTNDLLRAGLEGQWVYNESRTLFTPPICCAQNEAGTKKQKHRELCGVTKQGGSNYTGRVDQLAQLPGHGCTCPVSKDPWQWQTHKDGKLQPALFQKDQACELLGNRTVLLVGDSTVQQTATTLMNSFYKTKCAAQISFIQGDTLVKRRFVQLNRGVHWKQATLSWSKPPDIVILGAGPHVHRDRQWMSIIQEIMRVMKELQKRHPSMHFVFKTQQPAGCVKPQVIQKKKFQPQPFEPENPTAAARTLDWTYYPHGFLHSSYYDRDLWLIDQVQQQQDHHFHVLDLRPLYSRTDRHLGSYNDPPKDCLHFCVPGPLDIVAPIFYQLLQTIEQS